MFDAEIRWPSLVSLALVLGILSLLCETAGAWGGISVRPDWFWCLAFATALRAPPTASVAAFAWCGLARDIVLGPKMGAAAIAFILAGWMTLHWKSLAADRGLLFQALGAGASAFVAALIRHGLDAGALAARLWERIFVLSAGDALLTGLVYIPFALILGLPWLRPWRIRTGYY